MIVTITLRSLFFILKYIIIALPITYLIILAAELETSAIAPYQTLRHWFDRILHEAY